MGRLEEKMGQVAGAAERITKDLESRADAVLEREGQIKTRSDAYFGRKETILADAEKGLDLAERALALISNGHHDPLPDSAASTPSSPEVEQPKPFQP